MHVVLIALLVSTLTTTGLIALWAATSRRHWFLRTSAFLAAIAPLLIVPAYEPFLALALEGATIAAGMQLVRYRQRRLATLASRGVSPPAPDRAKRRRPRFRLATVLQAMALIGLAAAVLARVPDIGRGGWQSILACGLGGGATVLVGWYAGTRRGWRKLPIGLAAIALGAMVGFALMKLDWFIYAIEEGSWPPDPEAFANLQSTGLSALNDYSFDHWVVVAPVVAVVATVCAWFISVVGSNAVAWRRRVAAAMVAVLIVLTALPATYVLIYMATPPAIPVVALPDPNAYDEYVAAGAQLDNALVNSWNFDEDTAPRAQVAQAAAEVTLALDRARGVLAMGCLVPVDYQAPDVPLEGIQDLRALGRGFSVTARLAELNGDRETQCMALLDAAKLGVESRRGGLLVHGMVGCAISAMGTRGLTKSSTI